MTKIVHYFPMIGILMLISMMTFADNLNVDISKNQLRLDQTDSVMYSFYLNKPAITTIKCINVFGG